MNIRKKADTNNAVIFMGAAVIATLMVNLLIRKDSDLGFLNLSVYDISKSGVTTPSAAALILFKRVKQFILIYAVMRLLKADIILPALIAFLGAAYGALASVQVYYDGFSGIFLLILYILPHYIFYVFLIVKTARHIKYGGDGHIRFFALAFFILVLGALTECTVSKFFLTGFYQYMGSL